MFKKPLDSKSQSRLSGADRKKLRRLVREKFPAASDAELDVLLPPKAEIAVSKLSNRALVYIVEGEFPVFFDVDGRGNEILPTVFALWQVPDMLPAFVLKGAEVSRFIIGGADLMFPGVNIPSEGLPSFLAGEAWVVKVPGNMAPIAVGTTAISSAEALKAGLRGKALKIAHYYRDMLWGSVDGHFVPNAGFLADVVIEDPTLAVASEVADNSKESINDVQNDDHISGQVTSAGGFDVLGVSSTPLDGAVDNEEVVADISGLSISESAPVDEASDEKHNLSTEDVDALLDRCLLQALHTSVKDKDLPLAGSMLWSGHVLPCRPPGITLDIKKSTHKKLSKWLQSKSTSGLISAKEDKHKKVIMLLSVNRLHPEYTSFKPEKRQLEVPQKSTESSTSESSKKKPVIDVMEIYKPSTHVNPIFLSVGADTGKFYTASEATEVVFRYVEKENLVKPTNKAMVVLDATLCDALYKGTVKKGSAYPTEIHKKDIGSTFLSRLQAHHQVIRENDSAIRKGNIKAVQIMTERRQGNKKVTRVSGMESFLLDAESLASELQKKFACSTSVGELPGKKGQHEVLVQGGVIEDLARHLVEHYGVPKRYIEVLDKTKK